jgi:hypothetical protein
MESRRRPVKARVSDEAATRLREAIHGLGDYGHVRVRALRGHLYVYANEDDPVARLTPLTADQYGLSFHTHTGRWEPMPFAGKIPQVARDLVDSLGIYLARADFPLGKSGSDH